MQILKHIDNLYKSGINIIEYLKRSEDRKSNTIEDIIISYDFQAGSYIHEHKKNPLKKEKFVVMLAERILELSSRAGNSLLEAGVGEATTLLPLLKEVQKTRNNFFEKVYAFDISWSRVKFAKAFAKESNEDYIQFFVGDMFSIPLKSSSIDIVYTCHALEPNGGREKELLKELYRVTKKYLILLEPAYEFASNKMQQRMDKHGYVKGLRQAADELGYEVLEHSLYGDSENHLNPTGMLIIKKSDNRDLIGEEVMSCPVTNTPLQRYNDVFFSKESLLAYPVMEEIPLLTKQNAVIATKFLKFK